MILRNAYTDEEVDLRDRHASVSGVAQWFDPSHLSGELRGVSQMFANLAVNLLLRLPDDTPELTTTLRHLLSAKDAAVRCAILKMRQVEEG